MGNLPFPRSSRHPLHIVSVGYASGGSGASPGWEILCGFLPASVPTLPSGLTTVGTTRRRRRARRGAHSERNMRRTSPGDSWAWIVSAVARRMCTTAASLRMCTRVSARTPGERAREIRIGRCSGGSRGFVRGCRGTTIAKWSDPF